MSHKKETFSYRVKRAWSGGPEVGAEINLEKPINPLLTPNVERIVAVKKAADNDREAASLIEDAKAEAAKILDQARSDADGILNGAKAEAEAIKAEAEKALEEATKPAKK